MDLPGPYISISPLSLQQKHDHFMHGQKMFMLACRLVKQMFLQCKSWQSAEIGIQLSGEYCNPLLLGTCMWCWHEVLKCHSAQGLSKGKTVSAMQSDTLRKWHPELGMRMGHMQMLLVLEYQTAWHRVSE